ncbi:hypothetical protein CEXT_510811 [Caerostris extrusa]|uniref:Uncharacterized protein n=1 Tax=Caerostris extrusa TaxID=172846 RepID=A0AAV4WN10_CAEEX|nr:hypothetical protein CEXT_510811 [Caerostris extrusa]
MDGCIFPHKPSPSDGHACRITLSFHYEAGFTSNSRKLENKERLSPDKPAIDEKKRNAYGRDQMHISLALRSMAAQG